MIISFNVFIIFYIFMFILYKLKQKFRYKFSDIIRFERKFNNLFFIFQFSNLNYIRKSSMLSDKLLVKSIVKDNNLNFANVYTVFNNYDEICLEKLPNKFVVKLNHWCGDKLIVEKNKIDKNEFKKYIENNFIDKLNKVYSLKEFHYLFIKPKLFIEEYLNISNIIYHIHLIHSNVILIDTRGGGSNYDFYNIYTKDWKEMNINYSNNPYKIKIFERPKQLETMLKISENLCSQFKIKYVRLDFYIIDDKIYLSEFTFTHRALHEQIFDNLEFELLLGKFYRYNYVNYEEINNYLKK